MEYEPTIGLEIHIELNTESKMFCACANESSQTEPNKNICPVCCGHPGTLPVINEDAVKKLIKAALALNCEIARDTFFERKNYFYPDLPKGYQISQYQTPLSKNGYLDLPDSGKRIRIERVHLEEDAGRLAHPEAADYSLVDLNRAGVPLMELVTYPDIHSAREAVEFVKELQMILRYLGVSGANMEKGEMRCEVNISLAEKNASKLGAKVEIKNLNSLKTVERSIEFETKRQSELLSKGESVAQETRGWHDKKEITFSQRDKESAHDYRYFPEPDLPPLKIDEGFLARVKAEIPELPAQKRERFAKEYHLAEKETELYVSQRGLGDYFEKAASELANWVAEKYQSGLAPAEFQKLIKLASNYISTDLQALLRERGIEDFNEAKFKITPENFAEFLSMIYLGEISSKIAKMLLPEMFEKGGDPSQVVAEKGWQMVSDSTEIEKAAQAVIAANPKAVEDYKKGKTASLQFLVGQVMAQTKGKAKPEIVRDLLEKTLQ
ncbi:MAG: Asp-tRNA(Asn)/Glu-tRNA(Gln) amidotransferase subunit GatB [Candidatus Pacebacteria bacterium]|nr:Asp-tRNA(Asn)/Glu-tRNA(Gln) amidotransferase subunit GatB [Candidatus Paceibacterota bacterium]